MKLNPKELEKLVTAHYATLYRFALSLARNEAEAADLTQQTYFELATKGGQIRDLNKAKSWLFTTLRREFYTQRRQSGRFISIDEDGEREMELSDEVEDNAVRQADARIVMEAMNRVRETFRAPLVLFYLDDLSYREIAEILDLPIGTVMSRLSRGKRELRGRLSESLRRDETPDNVVRIPRASGE
ncbi:MAG: RNA polymerase sigma factor [Verrucomicrobiales bacterium]